MELEKRWGPSLLPWSQFLSSEVVLHPAVLQYTDGGTY